MFYFFSRRSFFSEKNWQKYRPKTHLSFGTLISSFKDRVTPENVGLAHFQKKMIQNFHIPPPKKQKKINDRFEKIYINLCSVLLFWWAIQIHYRIFSGRVVFFAVWKHMTPPPIVTDHWLQNRVDGPILSRFTWSFEFIKHLSRV